jgi:hypothetical protein
MTASVENTSISLPHPGHFSTASVGVRMLSDPGHRLTMSDPFLAQFVSVNADDNRLDRNFALCLCCGPLRDCEQPSAARHFHGQDRERIYPGFIDECQDFFQIYFLPLVEFGACDRKRLLRKPVFMEIRIRIRDAIGRQHDVRAFPSMICNAPSGQFGMHNPHPVHFLSSILMIVRFM